jgi:hypothetical protein
MASDSDRYVILGELKYRNPFLDVAQGAHDQLLGSLRTMMEVPVIRDFIIEKQEKRICYFNRQPPEPEGIDAIQAFNLVNEIQLAGFQMNAEEFAVLGFQYQEYFGTQFMELTA